MGFMKQLLMDILEDIEESLKTDSQDIAVDKAAKKFEMSKQSIKEIWDNYHHILK